MEGDSDEKKKMMMIKEPLLDNIHNNGDSDEMKEANTHTRPKGGFRTLPFIIANEAFERVASYGLTPNMILYLMNEYHMDMVTGTNILNLWNAATNFLPVLGAFLADSFVGRYRMIGIGSIFSLLGMIMLWMTTMIPQAKPPPCIDSSSTCSSSTASQVIFLCFSFVLMSVGAGGIRSCSLVFGADQLDKRDNSNYESVLSSYFAWYYAFSCLGIVIAMTCVVYIQENLGWKVGFGVPVALMLVSALSFYLASPFYVMVKDKTSLLTGFFRVIVASYKNRDLTESAETRNLLYYHKGSALVVPSQKLRFLNKACIIRDPQEQADGKISDSWNFCTVDQVEELKALIKVIPLWSTGVLMSVTFSLPSFGVLQASSMDRHLTSSFEIPAGSFGMFMVISIAIWVVLYDRVIIPIASRITGKPVHFTAKQRMGMGIFVSILSHLVLAVIENIRRGIVTTEGRADDPEAKVAMSAMWLMLPNAMSGIAEALNAIGQNEFYFSEFPRSMSSISSTLLGVGMSAASLVSSFIFNSIDHITKSGGKTSWVSGNINKGHYDYYFCVLAGLSAVDLVYFFLCSWAYGPCDGEGIKVCDEQDGVGGSSR